MSALLFAVQTAIVRYLSKEMHFLEISLFSRPVRRGGHAALAAARGAGRDADAPYRALRRARGAEHGGDVWMVRQPRLDPDRDRDGAELVAALIDGVAAETRTNTNEAMIVLLSQLATRSSWREDALAALRRVEHVGNYHYDKAVRRLVLSEFGLPTDDQFKDVPIDFVPAHFDSVGLAGQREMLEVADQQLIHSAAGPDRALLDFLAGVVERSTSEDVQRRARQIHQNRAPRDLPSFDRPGW